jgi:hypothetical protein
LNNQFERLNKKEREALRRLREQMKEEHAGASRGSGEDFPGLVQTASAGGCMNSGIAEKAVA